MRNNRISENLPLFTEFLESELAYQILYYANTGILDTINASLCQYLQTHKDFLNMQKGAVIISELIKYKICNSEDFVKSNPVDKMRELLNRPLSIPQNISELFTLHLIMFNYQHIFQPELCNPDSDKQSIRQKRAEIHRQLRPNQSGEMFNKAVRGREGVHSKFLSQDFGLFRDERPSWSQNWHRYEFTPHKYRAKANPDSSIVQAFNRAGVPFVAGPSGTTADCLEGLHFLMPNMPENDMKKYLNFLAAAEIAQGHHSLHEVLLVAINANLFQNIKIVNNELSSEPWNQIDYTKTYTEFLSQDFKTTNAYEMLALNYPQYFETPNRKEKDAALVLQKHIRAQKSYKELNTGTKWFHENSPFKERSISQTEFSKVSQTNVATIELELGALAADERNFMYTFCSQNMQLTHYTDDLGVEKIRSSGKILSTRNLRAQGILKTNSSKGDILALGNHDFVFLRPEVTHDTQKRSRFGDWQFIFDGRRSGLLENGWISLFDQLHQQNTSTFKELTYNGQTIRSFNSRDENNLTFNYPNSVGEINLLSTVFYGPDIMKGIALCMIRELRRIGGEYQAKHLNSPDTESLNTALSQLFRPEAKISSSLNLARAPYGLKRADVFLIQEVAMGKNSPDMDTLVYLKSKCTPDSWNELILKIDLKKAMKKPSDFLQLKSLLTPEMWSYFENSIDSECIAQTVINSLNLTEDLVILKQAIPAQKFASYIESIGENIIFQYLLSSPSNFNNLMPLLSQNLSQSFFEQTSNLTLLELAKNTSNFALFMSCIPENRKKLLFNDLRLAIQKPVDFLKFKSLLPVDVWSRFEKSINNECIAHALSNSYCKIDDLLFLKEIVPLHTLTAWLDSLGQDLYTLINSNGDFIKIIPLLSPELLQGFLEQVNHVTLLDLAEQAKNVYDFKPFMASISQNKKESFFNDLEKTITNRGNLLKLRDKLPVAIWSDFINFISNECISHILFHSSDKMSDLLRLHKVLPQKKLTIYIDSIGPSIFKPLLDSSYLFINLVPLLSEDLAQKFFEVTSNLTLLELAKKSSDFESFLAAIPPGRKELFLNELGSAIKKTDDFFIFQALLPAAIWDNFKNSIDNACIDRALADSSDWAQDLMNLQRVIASEKLTVYIDSIGQDIFKSLLSSSYIFINLVPLLSDNLAQEFFDQTSDLTLLELVKSDCTSRLFFAYIPENRKGPFLKGLGNAIQAPGDFLKFQQFLPTPEWNNLINSIDDACIAHALAHSSDWIEDLVNLRNVLPPEMLTLYVDSIGQDIFKHLLSSFNNFFNLVPILSETLAQRFFDQTSNAELLKLVTNDDLLESVICCIPDSRISDFINEYDAEGPINKY